MVALFSTLKSNAEMVTSSSSIPTVIQLYTSTPLTVDTNMTLAGHALLSYQAIEVHAPSKEAEETTLFGRTRKTTSSVVETPNLGVWNAKVTSAVVDSLLKIPSSPYYVMTVDLSDPSQVEPTMTRMQEALVRYLISCPSTQTEGSTTLYDLRDSTFGLAPDDTPPTMTAAPDESDRHVRIHLMICAITPEHKTNDYQETQAQNLAIYHLRRFASTVGATLVFVTTSDKTSNDNDDDEEKETNEAKDHQVSLSLHQLAHVWREFAQGNALEDESSAAIYAPDKNPELIETVLLRNANCPPHWDASKDSLWKALPVSKENGDETKKATQTAVDDGWLQQLRDSLGTVATAEPAAAATPTPKTDDAEVSSFFENLLKK